MGRIGFQLRSGSAQKGLRASHVSFPEVMKGCGDQDKGLQERLVRLLTRKPGAFPVLVSLEKEPVLIAPQTCCQRPCGPVKDHRRFVIPSFLAKQAEFDFDSKLFGYEIPQITNCPIFASLLM